MSAGVVSLIFNLFHFAINVALQKHIMAIRCFGTDAVLKHKGCVHCKEMNRCLNSRISDLMDEAYACLEDASGSIEDVHHRTEEAKKLIERSQSYPTRI